MTYVDNPPPLMDDLRQPAELKYVKCGSQQVFHEKTLLLITVTRQSYLPTRLAKRLREKETLVAEEVERENQAKKAKLN